MAQLTAIQIKQTKPGAKPVKLHDGGGLYLLIKPSGGKYWRYDYRYLGKRRTLALGVFPTVSLAGARKRHFLAKDKLSDGIDPGEVRKVEKLTRHLVAENSFEAVAREWFNQMMPDKSASYQARTGRILEKDLYPVLGSRPISLVSPLELSWSAISVSARWHDPRMHLSGSPISGVHFSSVPERR